MSEQRRVTYGTSTWSKGTRGLGGPWATDMPKITDMRMAVDGSLIPRPRFEEYADLTGETNSNAVVFPCVYNVSSGGSSSSQFGYLVGSSSGTNFYQTGSTTAFATSATPLSNLRIYRKASITEINPNTFLVDFWLVELKGAGGANSITLTSAYTDLEATFEPGARTTTVYGSTIHQGRAFFWGVIYDASSVLDQTNRIWFSDPYDYTTFTSADQYFDLDSDVIGAASVGANLFIWTSTGDWYMLQGRGDPNEGTLNKIGRGRIPGPACQPIVQDNVLYFMSADKTVVVRVTEDGRIDDITLAHLGFDINGEDFFNNGTYIGTASSVYNTVVIPNDDDIGESRVYHRWNDVWTEETMASPLTTVNASWGTSDFEGKEMLAVFSGNWTIHLRDIVAGGPIADIGAITHSEEPVGEVRLPRIADDTNYVRVHSVHIDARYWKGDGLFGDPGPYEDPAIAVEIEDGLGNTITCDLGPDTFDIDSLAVGESVPIRVVAWPATDGTAPYSHFSDVVLTDMLSMAIEKVTVVYEVTNARNF